MVEGGGTAVEEGGNCVVVAGTVVDGTAVVAGAWQATAVEMDTQ